MRVREVIDMLTLQEKTVLRQLASQYMEYASLPVQDKTRSLWYANNRHDPSRPMVLIDQMPWHELDVDDRLPKKYVMSNKPNPAILATGRLDEDEVRADLRRTIRAARSNGLNLEIILKDVSTVNYDPQKLWRWAEIAMEEVSTY